MLGRVLRSLVGTAAAFVLVPPVLRHAAKSANEVRDWRAQCKKTHDIFSKCRDYSPTRMRAAARIGIEYPFACWEVFEVLRKCRDDEQAARLVLTAAARGSVRPTGLVPDPGAEREGAG